jgi:hypothetical protein
MSGHRLWLIVASLSWGGCNCCVLLPELEADAGNEDAGADAGINQEHDAGDAGWDAGIDGGEDAGIDCSITCEIGGQVYCGNQVPSGTCQICSAGSDGGEWTVEPPGSPCSGLPPLSPPQNLLGFCNLIPGTGEFCTCAVNGSVCSAPTACCWGTCVDAGSIAFCKGNRGPCSYGGQCLSEVCCAGEDAGTCSEAAGECPD